MNIVVVGASGATGKQLVEQLLNQGHTVKAVVRNPRNLPESWKSNHCLQIISASLLDLSDQELMELTVDCHSVASCLGHTMSWKGIYGKPRKLVTDAVHKLCKAIAANEPEHPVKFVLINTIGNRNRDLNEPISFAQKCVIGLLRLALPPHVDNEKAADYLRTQIGQNNQYIEWTAVRPNGLVDENAVTAYAVHPSPIRSAIFNAGKISRINVADFMARLINDDTLWNTWKGQMPVLYARLSLN